jgi:hypothetical protein
MRTQKKKNQKRRWYHRALYSRNTTLALANNDTTKEKTHTRKLFASTSRKMFLFALSRRNELFLTNEHLT